MFLYKTDHSFKKDEVVELFKANNWHSGNYPDLLYKALLNYPVIVTCYKDSKLVGLVASMDDGVMNAYIHYVLVLPLYKGFGIGKKMMELTNEIYKDFVNVVLISYNDTIEFYKKSNYMVNTNAVAMLKKD